MEIPHAIFAIRRFRFYGIIYFFELYKKNNIIN